MEKFRAARDLLVEYREDYAKAYSEFRWPEMETFNWALDHFDDLARNNQKTALWIVEDSGSEVRRSFEQIRESSDRVANFLRDLGIRRGDRVLVMLPNRVELWEIMLAAIKLGAVLSPATTMLSEIDLGDRVDRGQMRAVIVDAANIGKFDGIANECIRVICGGRADGWSTYDDSAGAATAFIAEGTTKADDPCAMYFTSGTTSKPKMVLHTHSSYPIGHLSTLYWLGLRRDDVHLNISSPGWAKHAWSCFYVPWTVGATVFIYNQGRFNAAQTLATLVRCKVTTLCAPPTAWRSLILENLERYRVNLRELTSAGEPLNSEVIERVKSAWGLTIREGFGQTESTAMLGNPPGQVVRYGSMGRPLPGYEIDLLNLDGELVGEGEISVRMNPRPSALMGGYVGDEERTHRALGGAHYRTSDVASVDADGYYWYVGRADDVFKSSDYRISPFELESALLEHDAVAEAAVVESPDSKRLYIPKAYVMLKPGVSPDRETARSVLDFCRSRLAPYQKIRIIEFCDLPKTTSGKIKRAELRSRESEHRAAGARCEHEFFEAELSSL